MTENSGRGYKQKMCRRPIQTAIIHMQNMLLLVSKNAYSFLSIRSADWKNGSAQHWCRLGEMSVSYTLLMGVKIRLNFLEHIFVKFRNKICYLEWNCFVLFFILGVAKFHEDGFRGKYIFIHQPSPYWVVSTSVLFQPKRNSSVISLMSFPILNFPDSFFLSISLNEYCSFVRICYIF